MIDFLFEPYKAYPIYQILLELFAVIAGIVSVWFAKKNNILVYPIGLISTIIYIFLLYPI
jgi:nicotinamide mononucleotide transporter